MDGSALPRVKAAVVDLLKDRTRYHVQYASPISSQETLGPAGEGVSVWWSDEPTDTTYTFPHLGTPVTFDELLTPTLVLQVLGRDTSDTQQVVDQRAATVLGEIYGQCAVTPEVNVTQDDGYVLTFDCLPRTATNKTGLLMGEGENRLSVWEIDLEINARLTPS